jgi:hypothetical protein
MMSDDDVNVRIEIKDGRGHITIKDAPCIVELINYDKPDNYVLVHKDMFIRIGGLQ